MASMGIEAIAEVRRDGKKPAPTEGMDFFDTGVDADHRQAGRRASSSIDTAKGPELCWG